MVTKARLSYPVVLSWDGKVHEGTLQHIIGRDCNERRGNNSVDFFVCLQKLSLSEGSVSPRFVSAP